MSDNEWNYDPRRRSQEDDDRAYAAHRRPVAAKYTLGAGPGFRFAGHDVVACDRNGVVGKAILRVFDDEQYAETLCAHLNASRTDRERDHRHRDYVHYVVMQAWC